MKSKISEIQIVPIKPQDGLVGFASFVFDDNFYFSSIGVYTRPNGGYRLTCPTRKTSFASLPIFHPINKEITGLIEQEVFTKLQEVYERQ